MPPSIDLAQTEGERVRVQFALVCSDDGGNAVGEDFDADRLDVACMIAAAMSERAAGLGTLPDLLGLDPRSLEALAATYFPDWPAPDLDVERRPIPPDQAALATLIRWRGEATTPESAWLADIIARRAMQSRHLWEDLGLPNRAALTALMGRRFPRLVALNAHNMRWKKFFYRQICSESAFNLCLSPTCDACPERDDCFAPDAKM